MCNIERLFSEKSLTFKVSTIFGCSIVMMCLALVAITLLDKESPNWSYASQTVMALLIFFVPALFCAFLFYRQGSSVTKYLSQDKLPSPWLFLLGVVVILCSIPLVNLISAINQMVYPQDEAVVQKLTDFLTKGDVTHYYLRLLVVALIPAVTEEMFFRGLLQNTLSKYMGTWPAIIVSSLVFSLAHFDMSGVVPRFLLGAFLGYLLVCSGSLWLSIFVHFLNNTVIVFAYYYFYDSSTNECFIDKVGTEGVLWPLASLCALTVSLFLIMKEAKKKR